MATRELESSVAVSSFDVVEVTKFCELSEVVFLWFKPELSFSPSSRLESLVRVEALAQQNESTTPTEIVPVKQKA